MIGRTAPQGRQGRHVWADPVIMMTSRGRFSTAALGLGAGGHSTARGNLYMYMWHWWSIPGSRPSTPPVHGDARWRYGAVPRHMRPHQFLTSLAGHELINGFHVCGKLATGCLDSLAGGVRRGSTCTHSADLHARCTYCPPNSPERGSHACLPPERSPRATPPRRLTFTALPCRWPSPGGVLRGDGFASRQAPNHGQFSDRQDGAGSSRSRAASKPGGRALHLVRAE